MGVWLTISDKSQTQLWGPVAFEPECRAVSVGFEAVYDKSLKLVRKNHNVGLDSHDKAYQKKLIAALEKSKADFPRVFLSTAWPGTPFFEGMEKEGGTSHTWDEVRNDVPSMQSKHFTGEEAIAAKKEIIDAFSNLPNILRMLARWMSKDRSLIKLYLNMVVGCRIRDYRQKKRKAIQA